MAQHSEGRLLSHLLTLVAVGLMSAVVLLVTLADQHPFEHGPVSIVCGVFWLYCGILFLAAYYHRSRCYLFRFLMWLCGHFSRPSHSGMAFFYAALGGGMGIAAIVTGLLMVA